MLWALAAWTVLIAAFLGWEIHQEYQYTMDLGKHRAEEAFVKDVLYREWVASHGGLYVPVTEETPPNPHLSHIEEQTIETPSGRELTLVNPAYMTRQVHKMGTEKYGIYGHITSLDPIGEENAPDPWEREALEAFADGATEVSAATEIDGAPYVRLMRPFIAEEDCLKCHADQGYQLGDIRGGISVAVPMAPALAAMKALMAKQALGHLLIWLIGAGGIGYGGRKLGRQFALSKGVEEELIESERRLREMLGNVQLCTVMLDEQGTITYVNDFLLRTTGYERNEILGKNWFEIFVEPEAREDMKSVHAAVVSGERDAKGHHENFILTKSGDRKPIAWNNALFHYSPEGSVVGTTSLGEDITDRKRSEALIRQSQESMSMAQEIAHLGNWTWDIRENAVTWSDEFCRILGYDPNQIEASPENFWERVHPDDLSEERAASALVLDLPGRPYELEHRIIRPDGSVRFVHSKGIVTSWDEDQKPLFMIGTTQDITDRKRAERERAVNHVRLEVLDELSKMASSSDKEVKDFALEGAVRATESTIGYLCFMNEDETELEMHAWSKNVMPLCRVIERPDAFRVDETGLWGEAVRQRQPVITNDYPASPLKKGTPEGHVPVKRHMNIPLIVNDKIVLVAGVGNKEDDYSDLDAKQLTLIMDRMWRMLQKRQVDRALKTQEYYLGKAQEIGGIGTWELDIKHNVLTWTDENYRIFGVPQGTKLTYESFLECVHPEDRDYVNSEWSKGIKGEPYDIEHRLLVNGEVKWVREKAELFLDDEGGVTKAVGVTQDITERKLSDECLANSERQHRLVVEGVSAMIAHVSADFRYRFVNQRYADWFGCQPHDIVGQHPRDVLGEEAFAVAEPHMKSVLAGRESSYEFSVSSPDGKPAWLSARYLARRSDSGQIDGFYALIVDITDRKLSEDRLRQSEEQFRGAFETATHGMALVSPGGRWLKVNPSVCRMVGYSEEELLASDFQTITHPEDLDADLTYVQQLIAGEIESYQMEKRYVHKQGHTVWVLLSVSLVRDAEGSPVHFVSQVNDITARRLAEQGLQRVNQQLQTSIDQMPTAYILWDTEYRVLEWNCAAEDIFGYNREEILGQEAVDLIVPEPVRHLVEGVLEQLRNGESIDYSERDNNVRKDGTPISCRWHNRPLIDDRGHVFAILSIVEDVTEKYITEEALKSSEKRYRALFEQAADPVLLIGLEGQMIEFNDCACHNLGYTREEFAKLRLSDIEQVESPEDVTRHINAILQTGSDVFETKHRTKTGEIRDVQVATRLITLEGEKLFATIFRDFTERKKAEEERLLYQSKLQALASDLTLAEEREKRVVAEQLHDQVGPTLAFAKRKLESTKQDTGDPPLQEALDGIYDMLTEAIADLRSLTSELSSPVLRDLGFEKAMAAFLREQIEGKHGIKTRLMDDGQDKPLEEDVKSLLFRSVRELLINAVKHAQATEIQVRVSRVGAQIQVMVNDDGVGFHPSAVSSSPAGGSFGFFSIRERLDLMGGSFALDSAPGCGCTATIKAPLKSIEDCREEIAK